MIDIRLSDEGDLILGQQATDDEGYLLYYYPSGEAGVMNTTNNPDIGVIPVRDMEMVYSAEGDAQLIRTRLRTENPDWILYPEVGADLTDLIGEMNTPQTADRGIEMIYRTLTYDGAFRREDLEVTAAPVSHSTILFHIKLIRNNFLVNYAGILNFELNTWNEYDISIKHIGQGV